MDYGTISLQVKIYLWLWDKPLICEILIFFSSQNLKVCHNL